MVRSIGGEAVSACNVCSSPPWRSLPEPATVTPSCAYFTPALRTISSPKNYQVQYPVNLPDLQVFYANQGLNAVCSVGDFVSKPRQGSIMRWRIHRGWRSARG